MRKGTEWLPFTPSYPISALQKIKRQSFSIVLGSNNTLCNNSNNNNNNKLIAHNLHDPLPQQNENIRKI